MIVKEITELLEQLAPLDHAEDFDNVGLLVGNPEEEVTGVLVTLDTLENVVDEAIETGNNLIVSFHPIIFKGLKKITGKTYVERVVLKAIQNKIAIYSMHTALDNMPGGVNAKICEVLQIKNPRILIPQTNTINKLVTYVPKETANEVKQALYSAGAGSIGNYNNCSFTTEGTGSFTPNEASHPVIGSINEPSELTEQQLHIIFEKGKTDAVLTALFKSHPYEEVAYELSTLNNTNQNLGMGMVGMLEKPIPALDFLKTVKHRMQSGCIRHSELYKKTVQTVAVLGGSGAFAIPAAIAAKADIILTADLKYHDFYQAENKIIIADIGHYESEQFTKNLLVDYLTKKIPNFAISLSKSKTNPIKYF